MIKQSIWLNNEIQSNFNKLHNDIETDVLIIGGGIVGVLCAYELQKRNVNYVLVEKEKIGSKTSKDTTAFLTVQHETLYQDLIKEQGILKARQYLEFNYKALKKYKELSKIYDFDYEEFSSTLYTSKDENIIFREYKALEKLNCHPILIKDLPLDVDMKLGVSLINQAIINPYKLIMTISKDLNIYEFTQVTKIMRNKAYTKDNKIIRFNHLIIATHYPMKNISNFSFMKITQRRSYVCSIKTNKRISGSYCSIDTDGLYFRQYKDSIIIGGNDRDTGTKCTKDFIEKIKKLNIGEINNIWSGQDCITLDGIPYIGKYSIFHPNHYIATGFNLWGFTWAMASSFMIADMIEWNQEYKITSPNRITLNKKLYKNIKTSLKNLISFKTTRCKHLGCSLKYNEEEKTWECPCHGSRYNINGKVLDLPSKKNINITDKNKKI